MENGIIEGKNGTIIICGGNPLNGCPNDWDEAKNIIEKLNETTINGLEWSFDCGFKLDYDGSFISISSRFYPPKTHYGKTWDGTSTVYFQGTKVEEKKFDCETLDELKSQVEEYVKSIIQRVEAVFL